MMTYKDEDIADKITENVRESSFSGLGGYIAFDEAQDPKSSVTIEQIQGEDNHSMNYYLFIYLITFVNHYILKETYPH